MSTHASPPDARDILRERARRLAAPFTDRDAAGAGTDAIAFTLGRERYAVDARQVFAVFRLATLTPLPGARPPVVGVTQWRGDVLTVLDLRSSLGSRTEALDDLAQVVVVGDERPEFGLLVDRIDDTITLAATAILPFTTARAGATSGIARGITADAVVVLDVLALVARQAGRPTASPQPMSTP